MLHRLTTASVKHGTTESRRSPHSMRMDIGDSTHIIIKHDTAKIPEIHTRQAISRFTTNNICTNFSLPFFRKWQCNTRKLICNILRGIPKDGIQTRLHRFRKFPLHHSVFCQCHSLCKSLPRKHLPPHVSTGVGMCVPGIRAQPCRLRVEKRQTAGPVKGTVKTAFEAVGGTHRAGADKNGHS